MDGGVGAAPTASEMHPSIDLHLFDGQFEPAVYAFAKDPDAAAGSASWDATLAEITSSARDPTVANTVRDQLERVDRGAAAYAVEVFDGANQFVGTQTAIRIAWHMAKAFDERDLVFVQLSDMARTNGFCVPGRTNRMLQIIAALLPEFAAKEEAKKNIL